MHSHSLRNMVFIALRPKEILQRSENMVAIIGSYSCKMCNHTEFTVLEQRRKGSYGMVTDMVLRCCGCKTTFNIGATSTHVLDYTKYHKTT